MANRLRTRLHVPHPPARPGDRTDFSYLKLQPAGAQPRPDVKLPAQATLPLASGLVRVLDDEHRAVGAWDPHVEPEVLQAGLRHMLLTRIFDERMQPTQRQGRISLYMRPYREEAVSVAQAMALRPGDMLFPSYRNQGLYMVRGRPLVDLMCQLLSNTRDMCKGRQLPVMYHWRQGKIFSISGNLATQFPQAVGWAMAAAIKGEDHVAATWIGEGSSAEGDFHAGMVFAEVYQAPVLLNIVNNQWAISTFQGFAGGERSTFAARGPGYGVAGIRVDGNDVLAVYQASSEARKRALAGAVSYHERNKYSTKNTRCQYFFSIATLFTNACRRDRIRRSRFRTLWTFRAILRPSCGKHTECATCCRTEERDDAGIDYRRSRVYRDCAGEPVGRGRPSCACIG